MSWGINRPIPAVGLVARPLGPSHIATGGTPFIGVDATVTGVRALATGTGKPGSIRLSPSRERATATGTAKTGSGRIAVGERALASGSFAVTIPYLFDIDERDPAVAPSAGYVHLGPAPASHQNTTLAAKIGDAAVLTAANELIAGSFTGTAPETVYKWADPTTVSSPSTASLPNSTGGNARNPRDACYDAVNNKVYFAFPAYDNGTNFVINVASVTPSSLASTMLVNDYAIIDDSGFTPNQNIGIATDGTYIYFLSNTGVAGVNATIFKFNCSNGAFVSSTTLPNTSGGAATAIPSAMTYEAGYLYATGNNSGATPGWAARVKTDFSTTDVIATGIHTTNDDIALTPNGYIWVGEESTSFTGVVAKIKKDMSAVTLVQTSSGQWIDGVVYDNQFVWVSQVTDPNPSIISVIDPVTNTIVNNYTLQSGEAHMNEIFRQPNAAVTISFQTPSHIVYTPLSVIYDSTALAVSDTDANGVDWTTLLNRMAADGISRTTSLYGNADPTKLATFSTPSMTTESGWVAITATGVTASAPTPFTDDLAINLVISRAGLRAGTVSVVNAASNIAITGVRATATAVARPGAVFLSPNRERALATGAGKPGAVILKPGSQRAEATATARPGNLKIDESVVGVRALATANGKPGAVQLSPARERALATGAGKPGAVQLRPGSQRATATAAGKPGAVQISPARERALATGAGRPNAVLLKPGSQRAVATAIGRPGNIKIDESVVGVRATATVAAKPGAVQLSPGRERSAATATAKPGAVQLAPSAQRATAAAVGRPGAVQELVGAGVRALATAAGKPGSILIVSGSNVTITGVRATATAVAKPGAVQLSPQRERALATGAAKPGAVQLRPASQRATATAAGKPGAVQISPASQRAVATAAGRPGAITYGGTILGTRATATAAGRPGAIKVAPGQTRSNATCAGKPNAIVLYPGSQRAVAAAIGRPGLPTVIAHVTITGVRALATCIGNPGSVLTGAAGPTLTDRTRGPVLGSVTIADTENGETMTVTTDTVTIVATSNGRGRACIRTGDGRTLART